MDREHGCPGSRYSQWVAMKFWGKWPMMHHLTQRQPTLHIWLQASHERRTTVRYGKLKYHQIYLPLMKSFFYAHSFFKRCQTKKWDPLTCLCVPSIFRLKTISLPISINQRSISAWGIPIILTYQWALKSFDSLFQHICPRGFVFFKGHDGDGCLLPQ